MSDVCQDFNLIQTLIYLIWRPFGFLDFFHWSIVVIIVRVISIIVIVDFQILLLLRQMYIFKIELIIPEHCVLVN